MTRMLNLYLSGSMPRASRTTIVDIQKPPPMLCTPKLLPRKSSSDSMPFLTITSRGTRLLPTAKQPSLRPLAVVLSALLGADQTSGVPPEARVAIMIGPLRVWSARKSKPYLRNSPFSAPSQIGIMVSLWPP